MTTTTESPYAYWKAALAGEKPKMYVDDPKLGFYRRGIYEKQPNVRSKRIGWTPVAIFMNGDGIAAVIGRNSDRPNVGADYIVDRDKINELWSYVAAYPITEEVYRAVAERGEPWPDSHEDERPPVYAPIIGESDADRIAREIADCKKLLSKYENIESDEQASKARSLQQRFLDLRGEAKKYYETANRPLLDQQKELRRIWSPLQDDADAASVWLRRAMGAHEDRKREAARLAAEVAEKAAREHAEAAAKAEAANQPPPPAPEPVKSNAPAPSSQIRGGAGRAATVKVQKYVSEIDVDKVFQQFREAPELVQLLCTLAERAVRAGIAVPGATVVEKSDVR